MQNSEELIDNTELVNHTVDFSFSHGPSFGAPARIVVGMVLPIFIFGLIMSILNLAFLGIFLTLIFIIPMLFVLTSHTGVQLCKRTGFFKEYTTFVGLKMGKWKSSRGLTDVAILTIRKHKKMSGSFGGGVLDIEMAETGVYFLIPTHRKRILIKVCKNKKEADQWASQLAEEMGKKLTIFSPKLSQKTIERRNR